MLNCTHAYCSHDGISMHRCYSPSGFPFYPQMTWRLQNSCRTESKVTFKCNVAIRNKKAGYLQSLGIKKLQNDTIYTTFPELCSQNRFTLYCSHITAVLAMFPIEFRQCTMWIHYNTKTWWKYKMEVHSS